MTQSKIRKIVGSKAFQLLVLTVVLFIVVYLLNPQVINKGNIRGVLNDLCVQGVIMATIACLLISGAIDLSSGSQAALGSLIFAQILKSAPAIPWPVTMLFALCFGVVFGLINTFFTNVLNFMPFISTIGMSSVYTGIASVWTRGNTVPISAQSFLSLGKMAFFERIPLLFIVMCLIVIIFSFILSNTAFGRSIYMVGGNQWAARLSGLNPKRVRMILFICNSTMSVFAGIMWSAQKKMASPTNISTSAPDMAGMTAAILGGVSFMGGSGALGGAFVAMLLLGIFTNALTILKVASFWSITASGLILIAALILDTLNSNRQSKALLIATYHDSDVKKGAGDS
jgi:ribose/xylose/arabinose/galactoside ABC-type transport system permease subunit